MQTKPTIGIVGNGTVGGATARVWMEYANVKVYDIEPTKRSHTLNDALNADYVFVCLPSPQRLDSMDMDLSVIEGFFASCYGKTTQFILRSTVPIGTTNTLCQKYGLSIIHYPEFLTERTAYVDACCPSRSILGVPYCSSDIVAISALLKTRFPGAPLLIMNSDESELIKLAQNAFFATKIAFFNELKKLVNYERLIRWDQILEGLLSDGRICQSHIKVPGPDGRYGFGGTCLPKDTACLAYKMIERGLDPTVLTAVLRRNIFDRATYDRGENKDENR